jgi:hypothetical protein
MMINWDLIDWVRWSKAKILPLRGKGILVILHNWAEFQVKGQNLNIGVLVTIIRSQLVQMTQINQ